MFSRISYYSIGVGALALALAALYLATFWPGMVSPDSLHQFMQAKTGHYDDWHPPLMAFLWSFLVFTQPPGAGYLVFQVVLLCGGLALIAAGPVFAGRRPFWLVLLAGLCPPNWMYAGILWKDVLLAALWLCSVGCLVCAKYAQFQGRIGRVYWSLVIAAAMFGILGCMTRLNAIPAFAPLAFIMPISRSLRARVGAVLLVGALSFLGSITLDRALDVKKSHTSSALYIFDLGGITSFSKTVTLPGEWTPEEQEKLIKSCYFPQGVNHYIWGVCKFVNDRILERQLWGSKELQQQWFSTILDKPLDYVKHRLRHFHVFLQAPWGYRVEETVKNDLGFTFEPSGVFRSLIQTLEFGDRVKLFHPQSWTIAGLAILILLFFIPKRPATGVIQAGTACALLYVLSFLFGGVASDFRYMYWPIFMISIAALYTIQVVAEFCLGELKRTFRSRAAT
ncbi:hypothetical protein [Microvirga pudoricolor]|uniref:hypothetical protein n=1 Tax=Microvirga pudoricolor TaxID=2778729 RepID=UPI0019511713|nr:hypothetical protein [Microvirga pudoricolor]MBM6596233.1 hypothetical protein [Microvirga pudoricolor]